MRIILTATEYSWPNYAGGIKTYTQVLGRSLVHAGHDVHIITSDKDGAECHYIENGIFIHCVSPRKILPNIKTRHSSTTNLKINQQFWSNHLLGTLHLFRRSWCVRNEVLRLVNSIGVDIVEVPDWGAEGFWLSIKPIVPTVVMLHGPRFLTNKSNSLPRTTGMIMAEQLEKQAILRATAIASPSLAMRKTVTQEYRKPMLADKITVIPNPVNVELFKPVLMDDKEETYPKLIVSYVGRLEFRKGLSILAQAVPKIINALPKVRIRFIGNDTPTAPGGTSMKGYISQQVHSYRNSIDFIDAIPQHKLPKYYSESALVVIPSLQEPFGLTCAEAMSCGACVVASKVGGLKEIVRDKETGYLVPPGDVKALAQMVVYLLTSPNERKRIGINARTDVINRMSIENVTKQKIRFYEQILSCL